MLVVDDDRETRRAGDLPVVFLTARDVSTDRRPRANGAGLGRVIARRIARAHGGDLSVRNPREGGAEFTAWIGAEVGT